MELVEYYLKKANFNNQMNISTGMLNVLNVNEFTFQAVFAGYNIGYAGF